MIKKGVLIRIFYHRFTTCTFIFPSDQTYSVGFYGDNFQDYFFVSLQTLQNRDLLILEKTVDKGGTMFFFVGFLQNCPPASVSSPLQMKSASKAISGTDFPHFYIQECTGLNHYYKMAVTTWYATVTSLITSGRIYCYCTI